MGEIQTDLAIFPRKSSTYTNQKITYKVTKSDAKNGTVALTKYDKKKTSVVISATVTINGYTLKVTIGKNVTSIGTKAFQGCSSLKTIRIKSTSLKKPKKLFKKKGQASTVKIKK